MTWTIAHPRRPRFKLTLGAKEEKSSSANLKTTDTAVQSLAYSTVFKTSSDISVGANTLRASVSRPINNTEKQWKWY